MPSLRHYALMAATALPITALTTEQAQAQAPGRHYPLVISDGAAGNSAGSSWAGIYDNVQNNTGIPRPSQLGYGNNRTQAQGLSQQGTLAAPNTQASASLQYNSCSLEK